MPFTLSHAVLAPVIARVSQNTLPLAALAIGCMLPDIYRLFVSHGGHISHQWSGQIYPNLLLGLIFAGLWYSVYRPILYQLLDLSAPLKIYHFSSALRFIVCVVIALIIGNATHILWDGLTHVDYRTLILHDFLSQEITLFGFIYPLHFMLQVLSSFITLPLLGYWIWHYYLSHRCESTTSVKIKLIILTILMIALISAAVWTLSFLSQPQLAYLQQQPYELIGRAFNQFCQVFLILTCLAFCIFRVIEQFFTAK